MNKKQLEQENAKMRTWISQLIGLLWETGTTYDEAAGRLWIKIRADKPQYLSHIEAGRDLVLAHKEEE